MISTATGRTRPPFLALSQTVRPLLLLLLVLVLCGTAVEASVGDRLPEFKECVEVRDHALLGMMDRF